MKKPIREFVSTKLMLHFAIYEDGSAFLGSGSEQIELTLEEVSELRRVLGDATKLVSER